MPTLNKQSCPTCGQSVNERQITIFSGMVDALFRIWQRCEEIERWESIPAKQINPYLKGVSQITRFRDWKTVLPHVVYGKKGEYSFNKNALRQIFTGNMKIPFKTIKNPLTGEIRFEDYRSVREIPALIEILDENQEYIAQYL